MNRFKQQILTIALIAIGLSLYLGLKPLFEFLPSDGIGRETIAAVIGAILITLVTQMLLTSQQNIEQQNKKDDEIFRARLSLYQNFIQQFFDDLADGKITAAEIKKLKGLLFRIYAVGGTQTIAEFDKLMEKIPTPPADPHEELDEKVVKELEETLRELTKIYLRYDLINEKIVIPIQSQKASGTENETNDQSTPTRATTEKRSGRDTGKIEYKGKQYSKTNFVFEVFKDQIKGKGGSNLSLEKFEEFVEQRKNEVELDKYEVKHFEEWRGMPIWVTTERAEEIKKNSTEGEKWNRYRMSEPIVLKNKKTIVIRRGQNTESISAVKKIFGLEEHQ